MMKFVALLALVALSGVAAVEEVEYEFEWEYYEAEEVVDEVPEVETYNVDIQETEERVDVVMVDYVEYEYQYEYEYEGSLSGAGDVDGHFEDPDAPCISHFVRDCSDRCAPAYWIGNGLCDDGGEHTTEIGEDGFPFYTQYDGKTYMPDTEPTNLGKPDSERDEDKRVAYNFNCPAFWDDGGDCTSKSQTIALSYYTRLARALALQSGSTTVPVLAVGVLAVVAVVGAVVKSNKYSSF